MGHAEHTSDHDTSLLKHSQWSPITYMINPSSLLPPLGLRSLVLVTPSSLAAYDPCYKCLMLQACGPGSLPGALCLAASIPLLRPFLQLECPCSLSLSVAVPASCQDSSLSSSSIISLFFKSSHLLSLLCAFSYNQTLLTLSLVFICVCVSHSVVMDSL